MYIHVTCIRNNTLRMESETVVASWDAMKHQQKPTQLSSHPPIPDMVVFLRSVLRKHVQHCTTITEDSIMIQNIQISFHPSSSLILWRIPFSSHDPVLWRAGPHCFNANGPLRWQCVGLGLETVGLAHDISIPSGSCDTTKDGASDGSEWSWYDNLIVNECYIVIVCYSML